jgi:hypothetical protein
MNSSCGIVLSSETEWKSALNSVRTSGKMNRGLSAATAYALQEVVFGQVRSKEFRDGCREIHPSH